MLPFQRVLWAAQALSVIVPGQPRLSRLPRSLESVGSGDRRLGHSKACKKKVMATIAQDRKGACKTFRWQSCTPTQRESGRGNSPLFVRKLIEQLGIEQLGLTSRVSCASQPKIGYRRGNSRKVQVTSFRTRRIAFRRHPCCKVRPNETYLVRVPSTCLRIAACPAISGPLLAPRPLFGLQCHYSRSCPASLDGHNRNAHAASLKRSAYPSISFVVRNPKPLSGLVYPSFNRYTVPNFGGPFTSGMIISRDIVFWRRHHRTWHFLKIKTC